ncbi:hypothetical protein Ciccas_007678 [Cichlidogyrus casuarinus]|uniref:Uncharacterized protein n=1 Tax=Cichlidogyrus casuarinus TaxID=1844966 RepID=A0ABD2Q2V9_9PLAT
MVKSKCILYLLLLMLLHASTTIPLPIHCPLLVHFGRLLGYMCRHRPRDWPVRMKLSGLPMSSSSPVRITSQQTLVQDDFVLDESLPALESVLADGAYLDACDSWADFKGASIKTEYTKKFIERQNTIWGT